MTIIQPSAANVLETKTVYYEGTEALETGYVVCYDEAKGLTPAAGDFDEAVRGVVVQKPETANLNSIAGIVKTPPQTLDPTNDVNGFCEIIVPHKGSSFNALCKLDATVNVSKLTAVDDEWHLILDSAATGALLSEKTVAMAFETKDTSVTAALALVRGMW